MRFADTDPGQLFVCRRLLPVAKKPEDPLVQCDHLGIGQFGQVDVLSQGSGPMPTSRPAA